MKESVLEASWRLKRRVTVLYNVHEPSVDPKDYKRTSVLSAIGVITKLKIGEVEMMTSVGVSVTIPIPHIMFIDGRNPMVEDSPTAPEPSKERLIRYTEIPQPRDGFNYAALVMSAFGIVTMSDDKRTMFVERRDGSVVEIPVTHIVEVDNP